MQQTPHWSDENDKLFERYKLELDFLKWESTTLWTMFGAFFIGNSVILATISSLLIKKNPNLDLLLIASLFGTIVTILWMVSYFRNSGWYDFRMKKAKESEELLVGKDNYFLLNGEAHATSKKLTMGWRNNHLIISLFILFFLMYLLLILYSLGFLECGCFHL